MSNKIAIESLVMDLKRVAIGYNRGSTAMAKRFSVEAVKRKNEIDLGMLKPYIRKYILNIDEILNEKDTKKISEDILMISTLLFNYTKKYL